MNTETTPVKVRKAPKKSRGERIIVSDITQVSPDRSRKDIATLREAIMSAESITMPNRVRLYDLYNDVISLDGRMSGMMEKRTAAVLNKNLRFEDRRGQKVDAMDDLIGSGRFVLLMELLMESVYWGCTGVEFVQGKEFDFVEIPRKHLRIESGEIALNQYDLRGVPYADMENVWVVGEKYDLGKLLQCSMYALYKRSGLADFAQYVEIFGQPVRLVYYDAHDTKTKNDLRRMLEEMGSSLTLMIPKQAQFNMLDGKTSNGSGELQMRLIDACNEEMSIALLGTTETTSSSSSSGYAQAKVHSEQQLEITKSDMRYIAGLLNSPRFLAVLQSYGYAVEGGRFVFEKNVNLTELKSRLEIDERVAAHVPVEDDYWYDTYGVPKPKHYEAMKKAEQEEKQRAAEEREAARREREEARKKDDKLMARVSRFFSVAPKSRKIGADSDF